MSTLAEKRHQWTSVAQTVPMRSSIVRPTSAELRSRADAASPMQTPYTYVEFLEYHCEVYFSGLRSLRDLHLKSGNVELLAELISKLQYPDTIDCAKLFMSWTMTNTTRKVLVDLDADANATDTVADQHPSHPGATLLDGAVSSGRTDIAEFLIESCGADVLRPYMTNNGDTPLQFAEWRLSAQMQAEARGRSASDMGDPIDDWTPMRDLLQIATDAQLRDNDRVRKPKYPRITRMILEACWKALDAGEANEDATAEVLRIESEHRSQIAAWREDAKQITARLMSSIKVQ